MPESVSAQIKALQQMTVAELQQRWLEDFGKPTQQRDRDHMWKRLARNLQEGQDKVAAVSQVSHRLPKAKKAQPRRQRTRRPLRDRRLPPSGSAITRRYKGHEVVVTVLEKGFEYQDQIYGSLSAIAREITGTNWNGYLFFGLTKEMKR